MDKMIEKAKEELQMLETLHPHRFDYLKTELKSFISLLQSQILPEYLPTTSSATTQASTSMKRKRESDGKRVVKRKRDRVDVVLEKAQACLLKIQEFKFSSIC
ncbi:hypothetical protein SOVF_207220 [Spinacia oleracea]|uniref:Uncharacterized protein n=1 Tax=Spinacia oleracea TaxID=3562 RepID=A0A9R0IYX8_SPIOL|nr:uncharacterized protein LOC110797429 [Spinacia oleracea]KNA03608.1 hypothetical protein SOVF_207220 [Spinacia oleracea]